MPEHVKLPSPGDKMIDWEGDIITIERVYGDEGNERITGQYEDGTPFDYWWINDGDFRYVQ